MLFNFDRIVKRETLGGSVVTAVRARFASLALAIVIPVMAMAMYAIPAAAQDSGVVGELERVFAEGGAARTPVVAVAAFEHRFSRVGSGVAEIVVRELQDGGGGIVLTATQAEVVNALSTAKLDGKKLYSLRRSLDFGKIAGFDYIIVGCVSEFGIIENNPTLWKWSFMPVLDSAVVARIRLDYAVISVRENRVVFESSIERSREADGFKPPRTDTWMATLDFMSPSFDAHPIGLPTIEAARGIAGAVVAGAPPAGEIVERTGATVVVKFASPATLKEGDMLTVVNVAERLDTAGNVVWRDYENKGTLRVIEVRVESAMCEIVRGLDDVQVGMSVRMG